VRILLRFLVVWAVMTSILWGTSTMSSYREASAGGQALIAGCVAALGIFIVGHSLGLWRLIRERRWRVGRN